MVKTHEDCTQHTCVQSKISDIEKRQSEMEEIIQKHDRMLYEIKGIGAIIMVEIPVALFFLKMLLEASS